MTTTDLIPGRYKIVTDCGVSREVIIQAPPEAQTTQKSIPLYKVTIAQSNSTHPEYVKMDADVYNVGEVFEFYVVNEGPDSLVCANIQKSYTIAHIMDNGSYQNVDTSGPVQPAISYMKPGEATIVFRVNTHQWLPGRYRIIFDCGGVSRDFILREYPKVTSS